jgi:hypothetical protein
MDTLLAGGSASGRTPEATYWSMGETLSWLGEKWLGNPFITLAGLIPAPIMADVKAMTPQETTDHMMFHFADVGVSRFELMACLHFKGLFPLLFCRAS